MKKYLLRPLTVRLFFTNIFFLILSQSFAKNWLDGASVSAMYHYGKVLPEYNNFTYLVNDNVRSAEINITKRTTGENIWEKLYNYPSYGFSLFYTTLGNNKVHGNEIALYPYAIFHLYSGAKLRIDNKIGIGLSYVTKKYDVENNYQNIAVGSNLNAHFDFNMGLHYLLSQKFRLLTGIAFGHFSNGNLHEPNLGINYVTAYCGIEYLIGTEKEKTDITIDPHQKGHSYEIVYALGGKHARSLQSKFYTTSSFTFEYKWKCRRAFQLGIGPDFFYDSSTAVEMSTMNDDEYKKQYDYKTGIHLSQEFVYNKTSIVLQEGVYLGLVDKVNNYKIYNRGVVKYCFTDNFFASISMKSHLHILDYPELSVGFKWK